MGELSTFADDKYNQGGDSVAVRVQNRQQLSRPQPPGEVILDARRTVQRIVLRTDEFRHRAERFV